MGNKHTIPSSEKNAKMYFIFGVFVVSSLVALLWMIPRADAAFPKSLSDVVFATISSADSQGTPEWDVSSEVGGIANSLTITITPGSDNPPTSCSSGGAEVRFGFYNIADATTSPMTAWETIYCGDGQTTHTFSLSNVISADYPYFGMEYRNRTGDLNFIRFTNISINGTHDPAATMANPVEGNVVRDFQNWKISASNLTPGSQYKFGVEYGMSLGASFPYYTDLTGNLTATNETSTHYIVKSRLLVPLSAATTTLHTWYARAVLVDLDSGTTYRGNTISFTVIVEPGAPITPPTEAVNSTTTIWRQETPSWSCESPEDWTDIGGGISYGGCRLGQFFFSPSDMSFDYIMTGWERFQTVFPFSVFFTIQDSVESNATTTAQDYTLTFDFAGPANAITILSSSTLEQQVGSTTKNIVFNTMSSLIWIATAGAIILMIL